MVLNKERARNVNGRDQGQRQEGGAAKEYSEDRLFATGKDIYGFHSLWQLARHIRNTPCFVAVFSMNYVRFWRSVKELTGHQALRASMMLRTISDPEDPGHGLYRLVDIVHVGVHLSSFAIL